MNKSYYLPLVSLIAGLNCTTRISSEKEEAQTKLDVTLTITSTSTISQSTVEDFIIKKNRQLCVLSQELLDIADRNALQACAYRDEELCDRSALKFNEAKRLYLDICSLYQQLDEKNH